MNKSTELGIYIRYKRLDLGKEMTEVAKESNISRVTLSQIENGHTYGSIKVLTQIANSLNIDPTKLLKLRSKIIKGKKQTKLSLLQMHLNELNISDNLKDNNQKIMNEFNEFKSWIPLIDILITSNITPEEAIFMLAKCKDISNLFNKLKKESNIVNEII